MFIYFFINNLKYILFKIIIITLSGKHSYSIRRPFSISPFDYRFLKNYVNREAKIKNPFYFLSKSKKSKISDYSSFFMKIVISSIFFIRIYSAYSEERLEKLSANKYIIYKNISIFPTLKINFNNEYFSKNVISLTNISPYSKIYYFYSFSYENIESKNPFLFLFYYYY